MKEGVQVAELMMAPRYSPQEVERRLMDRWLQRSTFHAEVDSGRPTYSIVIPPPNVTGSLHMGHALNGTIQDMLLRYHHMRGDNTLWVVGTDHAGIGTQYKVEVQLAQEGLRKESIGRQAFEQRVWAWRREHGSTIIEQLKRLGCACDYERERFTMDEGYVRAVLKVFVSLYEKGDIYRDVYLVNWCTRCGSAISDLEVTHEDRDDKLYYVRYPVVGEDGSLTVATTRPETILGDTAVAVNPRDPRYGKYVGRRAVVPLVDREIPIIADEHVDVDFGTGALKITPGHDPDDWEIGMRHGLPSISVIGFDGRMNAEAGEFKGMGALEAREAVIARLDQLGLFVKAEPYRHAVGACYRCGTTIEPLLSLQWFMDMKRLAQPAIDCVEDGRVRFVPERWTGVYLDWMRNIRPWCVSRQLWWGHRVPAWYCDECEQVIVAAEAPARCDACGGTVHQDEDVLDTWFSSALWPFATLGSPDRTPELSHFYPTSVLSTARDIIYLWVARMIMMGLEFMEDVPFREVIIHPTILAADGRRMSKSLGTGVDPLELIDEYGSDATRFGLLYMSSVQDVRFSSERIEMGRNFANKIWNASRLVLQGAHPDARPQVDRATTADRWIFSRLARVQEELDGLYLRHDYAEAARLLYRFVWNEVCDWYLEIAKTRLYAEDEGCRLQVSGNLLVLLERLMSLLHPLMPFVSEEIYRNLPQVRSGERPGTLFDVAYPEAATADLEPAAEKGMDVFMAAVSGLRSTREELGISRSDEGSFHVVEREPGVGSAIVEHQQAARQLTGCRLTGVHSPGEEPTGRFASIDAGAATAYLALEGLVDLDKERTRLLAKAGKIAADIERARTKLANPTFVARAPEDVVAEERGKLSRAEATREELRRQLRERVGEELPE